MGVLSRVIEAGSTVFVVIEALISGVHAHGDSRRGQIK